MAKSQRKGSKEVRKPKKAKAPKLNASETPAKGAMPNLLKS